MAQPINVTLNGSVSAAPASSSSISPSLSDTIMIGFSRTYAYRVAVSESVNAPSVAATIQLGSITKVRTIVMRVIGASLTVQLTSPAGADQAFKTGDLFVWHSPNEGDQFTAVKLLGVADVEMLILGD